MATKPAKIGGRRLKWLACGWTLNRVFLKYYEHLQNISRPKKLKDAVEASYLNNRVDRAIAVLESALELPKRPTFYSDLEQGSFFLDDKRVFLVSQKMGNWGMPVKLVDGEIEEAGFHTSIVFSDSREVQPLTQEETITLLKFL